MKKIILKGNTINFFKLTVLIYLLVSVSYQFACSSFSKNNSNLNKKEIEINDKVSLQYKFPGFLYSKKYLRIEKKETIKLSSSYNKILTNKDNIMLINNKDCMLSLNGNSNFVTIKNEKEIISSALSQNYFVLSSNDGFAFYALNSQKIIWEDKKQFISKENIINIYINEIHKELIFIYKDNIMNQATITIYDFEGSVKGEKKFMKNIVFSQFNIQDDILTIGFSLGEIEEYQIEEINSQKINFTNLHRYKIDGEIISFDKINNNEIVVLSNVFQKQSINIFNHESKKINLENNFAFNEIMSLKNNKVLLKGNSAKGQIFQLINTKDNIVILAKHEKIFANDSQNCKRNSSYILCLYENPDDSLQKFLLGFNNNGEIIFNLNYKKQLIDFDVSFNDKQINLLFQNELETYLINE